MQVNKLSQSNSQQSFNSRYKIPIASVNVKSFEKYVVPLYEDLKGKPIRAFYSNKFLHVFTGKEDLSLFIKRKPKAFGVVMSAGNYKEVNLNYKTVQHARTPLDNEIFSENFKDITFEPLKDFQELVTKLLS